MAECRYCAHAKVLTMPMRHQCERFGMTTTEARDLKTGPCIGGSGFKMKVREIKIVGGWTR